MIYRNLCTIMYGIEDPNAIHKFQRRGSHGLKSVVAATVRLVLAIKPSSRLRKNGQLRKQGPCT